MNHKHIWIDLSHAPHILFFKPIINKLREEGFRVSVTVRNAYETAELAKEHLQDYKLIGAHFGKWKFNKLIGLIIRSVQLFLFAYNKNINLAISHGSSYQILAAAMLGIHRIVIGDYEHANFDILRIFANKIVVPETIPDHILLQKKINLKRVTKYSGLKENVYLPHFKPDQSVLKLLNLDPHKIIITVRPAADKAHYHNSRSDDLMKNILDYLCKMEDYQVVVLPRDRDQMRQLNRAYNNGIVISDHPVDSLSLLYYSDAVFSGGGTMNREAAVLDTPVYSFFQGTIGSVDQYLADKGKLKFINSLPQIRELEIEKRQIGDSKYDIYDALPELLTIIKDQMILA
jgi:predicted glycosyltransferase